MYSMYSMQASIKNGYLNRLFVYVKEQALVSLLLMKEQE